MTESVLIELESPVLRDIETMARQLGQSRECFIQDVVGRLLVDHAEQVALIEVGLAQLDRGEGVTQDEMEQLAARYRVTS